MNLYLALSTHSDHVSSLTSNNMKIERLAPFDGVKTHSTSSILMAQTGFVKQASTQIAMMYEFCLNDVHSLLLSHLCYLGYSYSTQDPLSALSLDRWMAKELFNEIILSDLRRNNQVRRKRFVPHSSCFTYREISLTDASERANERTTQRPLDWTSTLCALHSNYSIL